MNGEVVQIWTGDHEEGEVATYGEVPTYREVEGGGR